MPNTTPHALDVTDAQLSLAAEHGVFCEHVGMLTVGQAVSAVAAEVVRLRAALASARPQGAEEVRYRWLAEHPGRVVYERDFDGWRVWHTGEVRRRVSFCSPIFDTLDEAMAYALSGAADTDVDAARVAWLAEQERARPTATPDGPDA